MKKRIAKYYFVFIGIFSLIWFLIRVIPKPSRAAYPCQRAAFPLASSFIIYVTGLLASSFLFKKAFYTEASHPLKIFFLFSALIVSFLLSITTNTGETSAFIYAAPLISNSPVGIPKGIYPGRVVWAYDRDATRAELTNSAGDYWFEDKNTNQEIVQEMVNTAFCTLAGNDNLHMAVDTIFRYFNAKKGKTGGYVKGEKIVIKCNFQISSSVNQDYDNSNEFLRSCTVTSPQLIYAILNVLINLYKVDQDDIYVGDPVKYFTRPYFDKCHSAFPDVHYINAKTEKGRESLTYSTEPLFFSSDGVVSNILPQIYQQASYIINLAVLKTHNSAGITCCAKNHFGSLALPATLSASHLHYSLPSNTYGSNQFRLLVDIMGHKMLGENTVIFLVDGLWGGGGKQGKASPPDKWTIFPFNNDYPSSVFASLDPIALESVCFDFCYAQYPSFFTSRLITGVEDYLVQAADPGHRPENIVYDPERDGSPVDFSLGVFEHWNNSTDKSYSRDLTTGEGIELVKDDKLILSNSNHIKITNADQVPIEIYPNPVHEELYIDMPGEFSFALKIYDTYGRKVLEKSNHLRNEALNISPLEEGTYILVVKTSSETIYRKKFIKGLNQ